MHHPRSLSSSYISKWVSIQHQDHCPPELSTNHHRMNFLPKCALSHRPAVVYIVALGTVWAYPRLTCLRKGREQVVIWACVAHCTCKELGDGRVHQMMKFETWYIRSKDAANKTWKSHLWHAFEHRYLGKYSVKFFGRSHCHAVAERAIHDHQFELSIDMQIADIKAEKQLHLFKIRPRFERIPRWYFLVKWLRW